MRCPHASCSISAAGGAPWPNAASGAGEHLRHVFYRQGFNDQEIVALSGAHTIGRAFPNRSGFGVPCTNLFVFVCTHHKLVMKATFSRRACALFKHNSVIVQSSSNPVLEHNASALFCMLGSNLSRFLEASSQSIEPYVHWAGQSEFTYASNSLEH